MSQQVKNPPNRGVWWATVQRVVESQTQLNNKTHTHTHTHTHACLDRRKELLFTEKLEAVPQPQISVPQRLLWECWASTDLCRHRWSVPEKRVSEIMKLSIQMTQITILSSEDRDISLSFSFSAMHTLLGKERKFFTLKCKQLPPGRLEKYV